MSKFLGNLKKKKERKKETKKKKGSLQLSPSNQDTSITRFHFNNWNSKVSSRKISVSGREGRAAGEKPVLTLNTIDSVLMPSS